MRKQISTKLYFITLFITMVIFSTALFVSNYITQRKTEELKATEDKITVDILSLETQFDLLKDASCTSDATNSLSSELESLNSRLTFMEHQLGVNDPDVFRLKRYYSLLEIKDYLLRKKVADQCKTNDVFILYFYDTVNCSECTTQQYILDAVQDQYQNVHIYSFDYKLDLPAVSTLISLHSIPESAPTIDIQGTPYPAFNSLESMKAVINAQMASSTATSTASTTSITATTTKLTH